MLSIYIFLCFIFQKKVYLKDDKLPSKGKKYSRYEIKF